MVPRLRRTQVASNLTTLSRATGRSQRTPPASGEGMQHDQNVAAAAAARAPAAEPSARLSFREKAGYGIGDFGFNLYWANISAFLLIFYTDVMGLAAAAVGTMMLATRLVDAITD